MTQGSGGQEPPRATPKAFEVGLREPQGGEAVVDLARQGPTFGLVNQRISD